MARTKIPALTILFLSAAVPALWAGKEYPAKPGEEVVPNQLLIKLRSGVLPATVIPGFLPTAQVQALN